MSVSNKPILITAEASKYPKIQAFLEEKKIPHIFESLISLEFKPFKVPENTSWIFSSSPNIFEHLLSNISSPRKYKWGVVGPASQQKLEALGVKASFVGNGSTAAVAKAFKNVLSEGEKAWFPISDISKRTIQKKLNPEHFSETVVYLNRAKQSVNDIKSFKGLIFCTSPSNARSFVEQHSLGGSTCTFIAIGEVTQAELTKYGLNSFLCEDYTQAAILKLLLNIY